MLGPLANALVTHNANSAYEYVVTTNRWFIPRAAWEPMLEVIPLKHELGCVHLGRQL